jgi:hypothetical protein
MSKISDVPKGKKKIIIKVRKKYDNTNVVKGRQLADAISNIHNRTEALPLIDIKDPNLDLFYQCLDIYENNQMHFEGNIPELTKLEKWFCSIKEPNDGTKEWIKRERNRKRYGISDYCDKEIRKLLLKHRYE